MEQNKHTHQTHQQRGYHAPTHGANATSFAKVEAGVKPLKDQHATNPSSHKLKTARAFLIVLLVIGFVAVMWTIAWCNRSITFTINGTEATAKVGTSIQDIMSERHVEVEPGNFVSVSGAVLEAGGGDPFSLSVNGDVLNFKQAEQFTIQDACTLEVSQGQNIMENYTLTYKELEPALKTTGEQGAITYVSQWPYAGKQEIRHGVVSGEVADGDVVEETKDCVLTTQNVQPANDEKLVALTFNELTPAATKQVLQVLQDADAQATFFVTGEACSESPATVATIVQQNSQVASLSSQFEPLNSLSQDALTASLNQGFDAINKAAGTQTTLLRPPYGQFNLQSWINSQGLVSASVLWNQEAGNTSDSAKIAASATANVVPGSIILAADGGANVQAEIQALPTIIKTLQGQGFKLVTLKELLQSDASIPQDIATCTATLPQGATWPTQAYQSATTTTTTMQSQTTQSSTDAANTASAKGSEQ